MAGFLKLWGALIVAFVALAQPWIITLWRHYFRRGQIDIYETGQIELGYAEFGPTIGLQLLEDAGVSENLAADIVGHEKPRITYGLYSGGAGVGMKATAVAKVKYPAGMP